MIRRPSSRTQIPMAPQDYERGNEQQARSAIDQRLAQLERTTDRLTNGVASVTPNWKANTADPAIGNGTLTFTVIEHGIFYEVSGYLLIGSTTTFGTDGWYFTLPAPFTRAATALGMGAAFAFDSGTTIHTGAAYIDDGSAKIYFVFDANGNIASAANPMTWATNDYLKFSIRYPVY